MTEIRVEPYGKSVGLHIHTEDIDGIVTLTPEHAWRIGQELASAALSCNGQVAVSSVLADVERGVG